MENKKPTRMLRIKEVSKRTGLSVTSIYRGMSRGVFPKNFKIIPGSFIVGWREEDIDNYLQNITGV